MLLFVIARAHAHPTTIDTDQIKSLHHVNSTHSFNINSSDRVTVDSRQKRVIIFRPLFVYRQQQAKKKRIWAEQAAAVAAAQFHKTSTMKPISSTAVPYPMYHPLIDYNNYYNQYQTTSSYPPYYHNYIQPYEYYDENVI